ncbi:hypothetical protein Dimus_031215 [Dionaea muscipula]
MFVSLSLNFNQEKQQLLQWLEIDDDKLTLLTSISVHHLHLPSPSTIYILPPPPSSNFAWIVSAKQAKSEEAGYGELRTGTVEPCGACKFLRRKCVKGCIFAPYFDSEQLGTTHFATVHKVFSTSNTSKLLQGIPVHWRLDAVLTLCYEALARVRDPVYGCVVHIFSLQQQMDLIG